jgi:hypothetical protein
MGTSFEPSKDDMRKAKIVLGDALPYELLMLDTATQIIGTSRFEQLKKHEKLHDWFTHNATVEAFWTHARCLLEFFNRGKNGNFDASAASARDFTSDRYHPSQDIQRLYGSGSLNERINEQVSHVGFCRKAEVFEKLGPQMERVKIVIDKEVIEFDDNLRAEFREHWKWQPRRKFLNIASNVHTASCEPSFFLKTIG